MKRQSLAIAFSFLLLSGPLLLRGTARAEDPTPVLPLVEGFDNLAGSLPGGWVHTSFGEVLAEPGPERTAPRDGTGCLRIRVPAWDAGAAQISLPRIPLRGGGFYSLELWLRGQDIEVPVAVTLGAGAGAGDPVPYLSARFAVGPDWRRCVLQGRVPAGDPAAVLRVTLPGSGTLYVDSLRLLAGELPVEPEPEPPPPAGGNRIYNSSFELGLEGWAAADQAVLVNDDCPDGRRFARLPPNPHPLEARPFPARPGPAYTVTAYLRSRHPGARAVLALVETGNQARVERQFLLTADWRRYTFSSPLPCSVYSRYFLALGTVGRDHELDVDAVQVEEGSPSDYAPAAAIEIAAGLARQDVFPRPDEIIGVPVQVHAPRGVPEGAELHYGLDGFYGERVGLGRVPIHSGLTHLEVPIRVRIPQAGSLRLTLEARVGDVSISRAEAILTALPPLDPRPRPDSFFGGHGSPGSPGEWHAPTVAARAGIRWWRLNRLSPYTHWSEVEPARGRFRWHDGQVAGLRSRGMTLLGVLGRTPSWAGENTGGPEADPASRPPARLPDAAAYVRQVVGHYQGQIAAYETWDEPWAPQSWSGSPERYAEVARVMAEAARGADPRAQIIGGCFWVPEPRFTDRVLARGLLSVLDGVSHHQYTDPDAVTFGPADRDQVTRWHQALRGRIDLAGGQKLPIWNTEGGVPSPGFYGWLGAETQARAAARAVAKTLILSRACGARRYFYHSVWQETGAARLFDGLYTHNWDLLDYDGSGKPVLAALAACARVLEGAEPAGRVETGGLKAYVFARGGDTLIAAWVPGAVGSQQLLKLSLDPARVRVLNLMGNPRGRSPEGSSVAVFLRGEPSYILVGRTPAAECIRALREAASAPDGPG